jgi:large subunit ribosomal protein L5
MHRLKEYYNEQIRPALMKRFSYNNVMQVPRVTKVVVNIGVGEAIDNAKALDAAVEDLTKITGQKPIVTRARKSIANFKLREGKTIGVKVTLRGEHMWAFLDRLANVALPRTRDFRGISATGFDGRGNYTLGLREQLLFPESSVCSGCRSRALKSQFRSTRARRVWQGQTKGSVLNGKDMYALPRTTS